ncbi:esterase YqiA [Corallincola luteus]|uniref:Esterase YqiA n=3 Tax=Psychromonadaceae TaxID=267894 RepID=A0A368NPZ7_9GAMM|nr:esterase YqiA [Corallincola holothuriorum]TCI04906.1 esterase YqiA [Corallincola luteus]
MMQRLIYLHGFNSSSQSAKAKILADYILQSALNIELLTPQLANTPQAAWGQIQQLVLSTPNLIGCVGSSLGGFFATCVTEQFNLPSVLVNPAVAPAKLLRQALGPQHNPYTGESYQLTLAHMDELLNMTPTISAPARYKVLLTTGDEVLDYRDALALYHGAEFSIEDGGDHLFTMFADYLPEVFRFFQQSQTV